MNCTNCTNDTSTGKGKQWLPGRKYTNGTKTNETSMDDAWNTKSA